MDLLLKYTDDRGKITRRRSNGNCAKHQRALAQVVKQSRHAGLLSFVHKVHPQTSMDDPQFRLWAAERKRQLDRRAAGEDFWWLSEKELHIWTTQKPEEPPTKKTSFMDLLSGIKKKQAKDASAAAAALSAQSPSA